MRSLILKSALAAILVSAPFAGAYADANRGDDNVYQSGSVLDAGQLAGSAFSVDNTVTRSIDNATVPETDRSSEGRR